MAIKALRLESYVSNCISECVGERWQDNDTAFVYVEIFRYLWDIQIVTASKQFRRGWGWREICGSLGYRWY